jgi:hypothetical protein
MPRVYLAVGLLLVPAFIHSAVTLSGASLLGPDFRATNLIQADGARYAKLRQTLKPPAWIGFLDDPALSPDNHTQRYYLTQYALAPVIVLDDPALPAVLVNFSDRRLVPRPPPGMRYELMADIGGGVRLYHLRSD